MSFPSDALALEFSGFRLLRGDRFLEARRAAVNEIMRRYQAGETRETSDNVFYFPHMMEVDLDEFLARSGRLPDLGPDVPVASWVLGRLRRIAPEYIPERSSTVSDGGGYSYDFYLLRGETPIGWLQLQGNMGGVPLLGQIGEPALGESIAAPLIDILLDRPTEVAPCLVEVFDPDWTFEPDYYRPTPDEDSRNLYGWDGSRYLGAGNIREVD